MLEQKTVRLRRNKYSLVMMQSLLEYLLSNPGSNARIIQTYVNVNYQTFTRYMAELLRLDMVAIQKTDSQYSYFITARGIEFEKKIHDAYNLITEPIEESEK